MPRADTVIVGGGQAGLALSRFLTLAGHEHVVLERGRVGERWRSERWESLALLTPNWANRLPGEAEVEPELADDYQSASAFVDRLERYARGFGAPVHEATTVTAVEPAPGGFRVTTTRGAWAARNVVLASGDSAVPVVPWFAGAAPPGVAQLHASRYRSPRSLRDGGVLVVGSGPSGHQIAHELRTAGRDVMLAVGRHARIPRRYRGRDVWAWLHDLGDLERPWHEHRRDPRTRRGRTFPLDGREGGRTLDLAVLAAAGVRVTGRVEGFAGHHALLGGDLEHEVAEADARLQRLLDRIDEHIAGRPDHDRLPPPEPPAPLRLPPAPSAVDLAAEGVTTILWATGYRPHNPWLRVPGATGADGRLAHDRGVSPVPGLFVLGARWQHRATSHQIGGVGEDAAHLADEILSRDPRAATAPAAARAA